MEQPKQPDQQIELTETEVVNYDSEFNALLERGDLSDEERVVEFNKIIERMMEELKSKTDEKRQEIEAKLQKARELLEELKKKMEVE